MNPDADQALWIHGAGAIIAPGCGMYVNSSKSDALCVTGSASKSNFAWVDVVGQQGSSGNCKGNISSYTTVNTNSAVQSSPWDNLADPANQCQSAGGSVTVTTTASLTGTIAGPGAGKVACYAGTGGSAVTLNNATLGDGIYVFTTGVNVTGTDTVGTTGASGGGVLAVSSGPLNIATNSTFNIHAPTTGAYSGLALYQSASDTTQMTLSFGSSGSTFDGMIYAPGAAVDLHDQGGTGVTTNFGFVVGSLYNNGNIDVHFNNYTTQHPDTSPFRLITLVG